MKRRNFFTTAVASLTWVRLPLLAAAQSTDDKARTTQSSKTQDVSEPCTSEQKDNMQNEFKPGDKVPVSGIYDVIHDKVDGSEHTSSHQVIVIAGTTFPRCRLCREHVRFRLIRAVERVQAHSDFKQ